MGKIIDFVDYNGWGHAIHGHTFSYEKNHGSWLTRFIDKIKKQYRATVMVHSMKDPRHGDTIRYKTKNGIREAEIYKVDYCGDPKDMFTLHLLYQEPEEQNDDK